MGQKAILMAGLLTVALFACGGPFSMEETAGGEGALSGSQALQSGDGSACSMERSCAVLYIGVGNQFAEYPVEYTGELDENGQIPPEEVVSAMASLTGWSLDLAEPIFSGKVDPDEYSGFAFGIGIERIAMLKYGINNIGVMFENNLQFLKQFHE